MVYRSNAHASRRGRLQERFHDTFLQLEITYMGEMQAFCGVRLTDTAALLKLFRERTTRFLFVPGVKQELPED